ncbi:hypothetical protein YC2023_038945 [Brassica napus]
MRCQRNFINKPSSHPRFMKKTLMPTRPYNHPEAQTQSPGKIRTRVVATTGRTYVRARTRLTGHYRSMHHRDKPEPITPSPFGARSGDAELRKPPPPGDFAGDAELRKPPPPGNLIGDGGTNGASTSRSKP